MRPGRGILEVVRRYRGFVKHVVFALLIGRPVVVVGEIERKRSVACGMFSSLFKPRISSCSSNHSRSHLNNL